MALCTLYATVNNGMLTISTATFSHIRSVTTYTYEEYNLQQITVCSFALVKTVQLSTQNFLSSNLTIIHPPCWKNRYAATMMHCALRIIIVVEMSLVYHYPAFKFCY